MGSSLRLLPELEASIVRLPGVRAARVVTGPDAQPTEVHVLASRTKPPKQLVRDVQSLALAQFDVELDHRIVSVVQFDEGDAPVDSRRVLIAAISAHVTGLEATATVTLACGGVLYDGTATAPATASSRPRLVARAALHAVGQLLGVGACEVEQAQIVDLGGRAVAICVVQVLTSDGEQVVTGSALVRGDDGAAVARAVLDALNRRLATAPGS